MKDLRIEKKYVFGKHKEDFLENTLINNGFIKSFLPRKISSIYLDTENFNFAKDNINGVSKRKKIRFRWYNDDLKDIFLEEKNKQNFQVKKNIYKIPFIVNQENIIADLKDYFDNFNKSYNNFNYKFILKTNYFRSYWISHDKKIRATIDKNLKTSPASDLYRQLELNETILEFKFLPNNEYFFRNFYFINNLNLRSKKFSKYIQSFSLLEESGLIF